MRLILDYNEWAHLSVMTQSHHMTPSLLLFQSYANYAKKYAPRPREGGHRCTSFTGGRTAGHVAHPGISECDLAGQDEDTERLVGRWAEAMPKLCPLYSLWARLCLQAPVIKSTALKRAGQGWEENVVLIQLWNTTCIF